MRSSQNQWLLIVTYVITFDGTLDTGLVRDLTPRNIHVAAAVWPRLVSPEYPPRNVQGCTRAAPAQGRAATITVLETPRPSVAVPGRLRRRDWYAHDAEAERVDGPAKFVRVDVGRPELARLLDELPHRRSGVGYLRLLVVEIERFVEHGDDDALVFRAQHLHDLAAAVRPADATGFDDFRGVGARGRPLDFRRADILQTVRGAVAATTWIIRGGGSRRRRGHDVNISWRRVAARPRPRRG